MIHLNALKLITRDGVVALPPLNADSRKVACLGAAGLVCRALVQPQIIESGSLDLEIDSSAEALRSGKIGYAPARLPLPSNQGVGDALRSLHAQAGGRKKEVDNIFEEQRLHGLLRKKPTKLTALEHRMAAWTFALISKPALFVFEDPFEELSTQAAQQFYKFTLPILEKNAWLGALSGSGIYSRAVVRQADTVLELPSGSPARVISAENWQAGLYWLVLKKGEELEQNPPNYELPVVPGPDAGRYLFRKSDLSAIIRFCNARQIPIQSYFPADESAQNMLGHERVTR